MSSLFSFSRAKRAVRHGYNVGRASYRADKIRSANAQRRLNLNRGHQLYTGRGAFASLPSLGSMLPVVIVFVLISLGKPFITLVQSILSGASKVTDGVGSSVSVITDAVGVTTSDVRKKIDTVITSPLSCWSPKFFSSVTSGVLFTSTYADGLCSSLHDACGFFYTDLNAILGVFKLCSHQTQVSFLVYRFQLKYSADLANYICAPPMALRLRTSLLDSEMKQVLDYVEKLPR